MSLFRVLFNRTASPFTMGGRAHYRAGIYLDVQNQPPETVFRRLTNIMKNEGITEALDNHRWYRAPKVRRQIRAYEAQRRRRRQEFAEKYDWIVKRRSRGF